MAAALHRITMKRVAHAWLFATFLAGGCYGPGIAGPQPEPPNNPDAAPGTATTGAGRGSESPDQAETPPNGGQDPAGGFADAGAANADAAPPPDVDGPVDDGGESALDQTHPVWYFGAAHGRYRAHDAAATDAGVGADPEADANADAVD